jgi:type II secretory pathway component GspD/PulD (secretin)
MNMMRTVSIALIIWSYGIGLSWAQTDTPTSPVKAAEISPSRTSTQVSPPIVIEPVSVIPTKQGENGYTRVICKLSNFPAATVSTFLNKYFQSEEASTSEKVKTKVVIVPETINNWLFISGPPAAVKEVQGLVSEIDQPAPMVRLEVLMKEVPGDKGTYSVDTGSAEIKTAKDESSKNTSEKKDNGELIMRGEVCALNNQPATIKIGRQEPRISGVIQSTTGKNNSYNYTNVGTTIHLTPRIAPDGTVAVQLDIEDSRSGPMEEGVVISEQKDQQVRTPNTEMLTYQSTLRLQDGRPMMIYGATNYGKTRQITITAHIINPAAK